MLGIAGYLDATLSPDQEIAFTSMPLASSSHPQSWAGRGRSASLLLSGGDKPLELLEPVLDEDHFGDGRGHPLLELHHEESLRIKGQVIASYRMADIISGMLKKEARLARRKSAVRPDIDDPDLILPPIE